MSSAARAASAASAPAEQTRLEKENWGFRVDFVLGFKDIAIADFSYARKETVATDVAGKPISGVG